MDLTAVKMSMNPFDEVRAPPLDGFTVLAYYLHDAAHKCLIYTAPNQQQISSAVSTVWLQIAVEEAVRLKERKHASEVVAVSLGPKASQVINTLSA